MQEHDEEITFGIASVEVIDHFQENYYGKSLATAVSTLLQRESLIQNLYFFKQCSNPVEWTISVKKSGNPDFLPNALSKLDEFVTKFRLDSRAAAVEMLMFSKVQPITPAIESAKPLQESDIEETNVWEIVTDLQVSPVENKATQPKKIKSRRKTKMKLSPVSAKMPRSAKKRSALVKLNRSSANRKVALQCDKCDKELQSASALKKHRRIHTGEKPFQCEVCNRAFAQKGTLDSHMKTHQEKKFTCDTCREAFTMLRGLQEHMRTHTGERPYVCDLCGNTYVRRSNLAEHMTLHSGEKPYKCKFCDKTFRKSCSRIKHERIHTGVRPFVCAACGSSFTQKYNLNVHVQKHLKKNAKENAAVPCC